MEYEDPTGDGFAGYGMSGRMDSDSCLDSFPQVLSEDPACCYLFGHAVTPLIINHAETQIDEDIEVEIAFFGHGPGVGAGPILEEV